MSKTGRRVAVAVRKWRYTYKEKCKGKLCIFYVTIMECSCKSSRKMVLSLISTFQTWLIFHCKISSCNSAAKEHKVYVTRRWPQLVHGMPRICSHGHWRVPTPVPFYQRLLRGDVHETGPADTHALG